MKQRDKKNEWATEARKMKIYPCCRINLLEIFNFYLNNKYGSVWKHDAILTLTQSPSTIKQPNDFSSL